MSIQHSAEIGGLIFFGNPMEAVPRRLIASDELTNDDKVGWMLIRILSYQHHVVDIETSEQLSRLLNGRYEPDCEKVKTVILKLRLTRWLASYGENSDGQRLYGLFDEPASIQEVQNIDQLYPQLVLHAAQHADESIRRLAKGIHCQLLPDH